MEHEQVSNLAGVCASCTEEQTKSWQENHADTVIQPGDFVKILFGDLERMWVEVVSVVGSEISGRLSNTPAVLTDVKIGDRVSLQRSQVIDWLHL